jgi:ABC-type multidrug transport system fused ATPase/permease subunit
MQTLKNLLKLLSPQEKRRGCLLLVMILIMALFDMIGVASILPFMAVISNPELIEANDYLATTYLKLNFTNKDDFLFFLGGSFFITIVLSTMFKALTTYALVLFTQMRNYSLSRRMVEGYLNQQYDWFLNRHSADIGKTVLSEVAQVINGALIPLLQLISHTLVALTLLILLMLVDYKLTLVVIICLGGAYTLIYLSTRGYITRLGEIQVKANRERFHVVQEVFGAIKDIKLAGLEKESVARYEDPSKKFANGEAKAQIVSLLPRYILELLTFGGMVLVLLYTMRNSGSVQGALPVMSVYALASLKLMPALQQIYAQITRMRFASPALKVLHDDIATLHTVYNSNASNNTKKMRVREEVQLDAVSYSYPNMDKLALNNCSLRIQANTTIGFVGTTGSGKTTIIDTVLGLLIPKSGALWIDEQKITKANVSAWQRSIGYVPQHIYLSDESVAANIAFGIHQSEIDVAAVVKAAKIANLHDFILQEMPAGYDTLVGERGVRLSGGQRQRIGIARALYHDPDVLVFDEATSALDNVTEQLVMNAISKLSHRKTIIIIAHRLSTVKSCDEIFLLEHGRIVESGTFDELLQNNDKFKSMAALDN